MQITEIKIVEVGVNIEIRLKINGIFFYSKLGFETEQQAKQILEQYGIQEANERSL